MRILIAEDDAVSRRLLEATLAKWSYEVVVCRDGADDYITKPFVTRELKLRLRAGRRILELQSALIAGRDRVVVASAKEIAVG